MTREDAALAAAAGAGRRCGGRPTLRGQADAAGAGRRCWSTAGLREHVGREAGFRAGQAQVVGAAVGHRQQAADAPGDGVLGQRRVRELGQLADPPLTKDAIAGRIRRLLAMADRRASDLGLPSTEASLTMDMLP